MLETILNYRKFISTDKEFKNIVFYSEGEDYDHFYLPYINSCLKNKIKFSYVSSGKKIPFEKNVNSKFFFIGDSFIRTLFFFLLDCKNLITTMPDLENFFLKKSSRCNNYIYFFHSMFSMNTIYNHNAFSHYDTILCSNKISANEVKDYFFSNNKAKFVNLGYPKIDNINERYNEKNKNILIKSILFAPSWGNEDENFNIYKILISQLIKEGYLVNFRPHPATLKYSKKTLDKVFKDLADNKNFNLSHEKNNLNDYLQNDLVITDWSGAAIEFALATKKRCIFFNSKQKIRNKKLSSSENLKSLEIIFKTQVAENFDLNNFNQIFKKISSSEYLNQYEKKIELFRKEYLYNFSQTDKGISEFFQMIK